MYIIVELFLQLTWTCAEFYEFWHWYTCKSLLNTLGRAVEQLTVCPAKQTKVSSRGQSTSHAKPAQSVKTSYEYLIR